MALESGVVSKDLRFAVIVPLYKDKGKRNECKNYLGISLLNMDSKIYAGIRIKLILEDSREISKTLEGEVNSIRSSTMPVTENTERNREVGRES